MLASVGILSWTGVVGVFALFPWCGGCPLVWWVSLHFVLGVMGVFALLGLGSSGESGPPALVLSLPLATHQTKPNPKEVSRKQSHYENFGQHLQMEPSQ